MYYLKLIEEIKQKFQKINFIGNNNVKSKRLKDIIASEENKFWKFISKNTVLSERSY